MRQTPSPESRTLARPEVAVLVLEPAHRRAGGPTVVLTGPRYVIGSGADDDIRLTLDGIEPRHCTLELHEGRLQLQGHSSRTWLNDSPTRRATVRAGDRLAVGPCEFRIRKATTEELLQHLPRQMEPSAVETAPKFPSPPPLPLAVPQTGESSLTTLQSLERELGRELSAEPPSSPVKPQPEQTPPPVPLYLSLPEVATPPHAGESDDRERLNSLLSGWDAEAETLRRELLAQAESLNGEIRRQQEELEELQQQTRRSADALERERAAAQNLQTERQRTEEDRTGLERQEQELTAKAAELERERFSLTERLADQEYAQRRQQAELAATAQWWEQRRSELTRRQNQFANLTDLLRETQRELLEGARNQEVRDQELQRANREHGQRLAELTQRDLHLGEWEGVLVARDKTTAAKLSEVTRGSAALSVRALDLAERERTLADRRTVIEAREKQLHQRETELASGQMELDQRDFDLQSRVNAFFDRQQQQTDAVPLQSQKNETLAARETELNRRDAEAADLRERLVRERVELDEDLLRAEQIQRQLRDDRQQLIEEREHLTEEQSRFRSECQRFATEVDALAAERRQFEEIRRAAAAIPQAVATPLLTEPAAVSAVDEERWQAEQEKLRGLQDELERTRFEIEDERHHLSTLERSVAEQTEALEAERESMLADRRDLDHERQLIVEQRLKAQDANAALVADRDQLQAEMRALEESRGQMSAELDLLRARQQELDKQFEHRHAEVTDWLQEHAESQPVAQPQVPSSPAPPAATVPLEMAEPEIISQPPPRIGNLDFTQNLAYSPDNHGTLPAEDVISPPFRAEEFRAEEFRHEGGNLGGMLTEGIPSDHSWSPGRGESLPGVDALSPWNDPPVQPAAEVSTPDTAQAPDEVRVRSLLAEMFNLPASDRTEGGGAREETVARESAKILTTDVTDGVDEDYSRFRFAKEDKLSAPGSDSQSPAVDLTKLNSRESSTDQASVGFPEVAPPSVASAIPEQAASGEHTLESADPDSIAAYMERLLQRNRRRGQDDEGISTPPPRPAHPPIVAASPIVVASPVPSEEVADPAEQPAVEPFVDEVHELPVRPRVDTQELRAGIDSLRQVANLSARTAVASHTWKQTRSLIYLRALLTLASFGVAGFILVGPIPDRENFLVSGYAALFIAVIAGADFLRTWWRVFSIDSLRRRSERSVSSHLPNRIAAGTGVEDDFAPPPTPEG